MRRTLVTLLLLAVVAWFIPPQAEDVSGQCRALESQVVRLQSFAASPDAARDAAVVRRALDHARQHHATLPQGVACFLTYWDLVFDSDLSLFQPAAP